MRKPKKDSGMQCVTLTGETMSASAMSLVLKTWSLFSRDWRRRRRRGHKISIRYVGTAVLNLDRMCCFPKKKYIQYVYSHRFESELSLDSFPNTHDKKWIEVIFSIVTTHELNIVCNSCVYCVRTVWFLAVPMMQTQHWTRTWRVLMRRRISVWRAWGRRTRGWIRWMLKSSTSSTESWIRWMKRASSSLRNINVGLNKRSRASGTESCCPCVFVQSLTTLVYQNSSFKVPFIMMTTIS